MLTTETFSTFIANYARRLADLQETLNTLDNNIGDGDHGTNMARGFKAASEQLAAKPATDVGGACNTVGMALLSSVGGASGPLYATVFMRFATAWKGMMSVDATNFAAGIAAALEGLQARGKADVGDKTMIDVWHPVNQILKNIQETTALQAVVETAGTAALATKPRIAKKGRAAYLGERSVGHCDPGSISSAVLFEELVDATIGGVERKPWPKLAL